MSEQHTPGLLPPMPLKLFSVNGTTAILDADGNEVVGWMGFDNSDRTKAQHKALAARLVQCSNAHDELVAALDKLAHYAECQVAAFTAGRPYLDMTLFPGLCRDARAALAKAGVQP